MSVWSGLAIALFVNGAKGVSALQISRDLDVQYKTAYVLCHKLREALGAAIKDEQVGGLVEIDGAYFGGYVKPENHKRDRPPEKAHAQPSEFQRRLYLVRDGHVRKSR